MWDLLTTDDFDLEIIDGDLSVVFGHQPVSNLAFSRIHTEIDWETLENLNVDDGIILSQVRSVLLATPGITSVDASAWYDNRKICFTVNCEQSYDLII